MHPADYEENGIYYFLACLQGGHHFIQLETNHPLIRYKIKLVPNLVRYLPMSHRVVVLKATLLTAENYDLDYRYSNSIPFLRHMMERFSSRWKDEKYGKDYWNSG
jgi:hypothetical protein